VLKSFKDDLDECAAGLIWEFNRVHSQNIGLDGFSDLTGTTAVIDPAVALDELTYSFTPKGDTFEIQNGNFELVVHDTMSDEEIIRNVEVDLDDNTADPDTILYDASNPTAANALVNKIQNALDTVQPGAFTVGLDLANRLQIQSNSEEFTLSFGRDTSGALAALGLNTFFSGYDAGSITMNGVAEDNPDFVAGAKSFTPGDNTGALALLELRDTGVFDNDTATVEDFYEGIVGRLGVEGDRVNSLMETQEDVLTRMKNQREDLSGVNLDEELTKMIQYQRSFQSAARFVSTADVIYETLINM
jgi:flagellar hook-associated protein 1